MHFNSSCSFTALAMLLEEKGIDTEDTEIALEMGLPWLFAEKEGAFLSGPMLQGNEWFKIFLYPRGYRLCEEDVAREDLPEYLRIRKMSMLGMKVPGENGKHAVVFAGFDGSYSFLNPTHEGSGRETEFSLSEEELVAAVPERIMVGHLEDREKEFVDTKSLMEASVTAIRRNVTAITEFAGKPHSGEEYKEAMDTLFRAILLDGITMLELAGETALAGEFKELQKELLTFMRGDKSGLLSATLSISRLEEPANRYMMLIREHIGTGGLS